MPLPSGFVIVPPQIRQPPELRIHTAGTRVPAIPVKPAPGSKTTLTVPPETTRLKPMNSPGIFTVPRTLIVWPALAFATAVVNAEADDTVIAFVRLGIDVSRYDVTESNVFETVFVTTAAVASDCALVQPAALVAVTTIRSVLPSCVLVSANVPEVAPAMFVHEVPLELHCVHW